jgi:hypothetical protein
MKEREPRKEIIGRGELFYLWQPGTAQSFSSYGLTTETDSTDCLVGLLMIDRPRPADRQWLEDVEWVFGKVQLAAMTAACRSAGKPENGASSASCWLASRRQIEADSLPHLRRLPSPMTPAIQEALGPLLENPPNPVFSLRWDKETRAWTSQFALPTELHPADPRQAAIRAVFERTGYGCLAAETNVGVVHICHAADAGAADSDEDSPGTARL